MKCPYCGQEHPDNYKFCPETAKPLTPQTKVCCNPDCKYENVPIEAKFCPRCGCPFGDITQKGQIRIQVGEVNFNMIHVKAGSFLMGSNEYDDIFHGKPLHKVTITKDYYIGETVVTQKLWKEVMGHNPSYWGKKNGLYSDQWELLPVEQVDWFDCIDFIKKLNELTGRTFRLPTEAEWEFAARGGQESEGYKFAGSDIVDEVAWWPPCDQSVHPVAQKKPNELGLYDMCGNIYEWCQDWLAEYNNEHQYDPVCNRPNYKDYKCRIIRGGHSLHSGVCSVNSRNGFEPERWGNYTGFRLCMEME